MMGASFAFVLPVLAIIDDYSDEYFTSEHQVCKVQAVCDLEKRERENLTTNLFRCLYLMTNFSC